MKKFGDRKDGTLIRKFGAFHNCMINVNPRRTESEACILDIFDLTNVYKYLKQKEELKPKYKYSMFQFIVAALAKTAILRPKLNNFIVNKKIYKRNYYSASFVIKKQYDDKSEEGMANIRFNESDNIDSLHNYIESKIYSVKKGTDDEENFNLNFVEKCPRQIMKIIFLFLKFLDKHGKLPSVTTNDDPLYSTFFLTNLGSIGCDAGYHHLCEWGTNSIFCVIGKAKKRPFFEENGSYCMKDSVKIGLVLDERIADGYYYAKSIKLIKYLFEHPEELDKPFSTSVNYA